MNLFAEAMFGPNAEAAANQQHSDQQFGINGRATGMAVKIG